MSISPKVGADIKEGGGRHYRGRGLGELQAWKCPGCGAQNTGKFAAGCASCGAGTPGQQVRRSGDPLMKMNPDGRLETAGSAAAAPTSTTVDEPRRSSPCPAGSGIAAQVRQRAPSVDYDEIERRVLHALDARLGGGFSDAERATLYMALECYTTLWEDGTIEPGGGLTLPRTRELMAKIAPESGLEMEERHEEPDATDTQPTEGDTEQGYDDRGFHEREGADSARIWDDDPDAAERRARGEFRALLDHSEPIVARRTSSDGTGGAVTAPQFVDAGDRPDEVGEDDATRNRE